MRQIAVWLLVPLGIMNVEVLHAANKCELGKRAMKEPSHTAIGMLGNNAYDPVALRNHIEWRKPFAATAAYLLGFGDPDENTVIVLRKAIHDEDDPVLGVFALEALCRLGINDVMTDGPRRMRALGRDQRMAAQIAGVRLAGLLATNGVYDGWAYVRNALVTSNIKSAGFSAALQCLGDFERMEMSRGVGSIYKELLETVPPGEGARRDLIQQHIPINR